MTTDSRFARRGELRKGRFPRLTIIHTASILNLRGSEFWTIDVGNLLARESFSVTVLNFDFARRYPKTRGEIERRIGLVKDYVGKDVTLIRLRALSLRLPFTNIWHGSSAEKFVDRYLHFLPLDLRFTKMLRESDVIYFVVSQQNPAYLILTLGLSLLVGRKPVIAGLHVTPKFKVSELALLKLATSLGVLRGIHVVNRAHESMLRDVGCRVEYVPNGVYFDRFYSDIDNKSRQDLFSILFVGAMTATKGADMLPEIYDFLKKSGFSFRFVICTSGGELEGKIMEWTLGKSDVQFKGFVDRVELARLYANANVAVFPSIREAFPLACLEVQASGTPVVVSDVPGLAQVVTDRRNGLIVAKRDGLFFANAIEAIYSLWKSNREAYLAMCKSAQDNIRVNYQWNSVVKRLVGLLDSAMKRN